MPMLASGSATPPALRCCWGCQQGLGGCSEANGTSPCQRAGWKQRDGCSQQLGGGRGGCGFSIRAGHTSAQPLCPVLKPLPCVPSHAFVLKPRLWLSWKVDQNFDLKTTKIGFHRHSFSKHYLALQENRNSFNAGQYPMTSLIFLFTKHSERQLSPGFRFIYQPFLSEAFGYFSLNEDF